MAVGNGPRPSEDENKSAPGPMARCAVGVGAQSSTSALTRARWDVVEARCARSVASDWTPPLEKACRTRPRVDAGDPPPEVCKRWPCLAKKAMAGSAWWMSVAGSRPTSHTCDG
ncbi:hypothetical protein BCR44DRAFT_1425238 [Catenaria anguillulae PL171]|uniref:Uncharacterized protein n=1 Tax=Catenaria anguillulae PL171 TaxID=765915 RepID=A0A1Y2I1A0_9FUNG|nr:hypothetical protein BCR44DRAFT_1425238 [Catenaria anguillulae PL171]